MSPNVPALSKRQIDKLGERLRDSADAEDRALLRQRRDTFRDPLLAVAFDLERMGLGKPDGLRLKRPESVIAKLKRDARIRLSRMQDMAGCRLVTNSKAEQDLIYARLQSHFDVYRAYDMRDKPHSGYRAVHVVVRMDNKFVEVQVRTQSQKE